jgi:hypothetical protein
VPLNMKALEEGSIFWSADEYWAVIGERARLEVTPHDDWNRDLGRIHAPDMPGGPATLRFNPDIVTNQVMDFMVKRYRDLDRLTVMSHMNRYMVMNEFLRVNEERLIADDMIRAAGPDYQKDELGLHSALVEALAESRYEAKMINAGGHEVRTFDYDEVVQLAKAKIKEHGD